MPAWKKHLKGQGVILQDIIGIKLKITVWYCLPNRNNILVWNEGVEAEVAPLTLSPNDPQWDFVLPALVVLGYEGLKVLVPTGGILLWADSTRIHSVEQQDYSCLQGPMDSVSRNQQMKRRATTQAEVTDPDQWEDIGLLLLSRGWSKYMMDLDNPPGVSWYSHASE